MTPVVLSPPGSTYVPLSLQILYVDIRTDEGLYAMDAASVFDEFDEVERNLCDVDIATIEDAVYKGRTFKNKKECQLTLPIYAIKRLFHYKQTRSTLKKVVCMCLDPRCDFYVFAAGVPNSNYFEIRKAVIDHKCDIMSRAKYTKHATTKVISELMKSKYVNGAPRPVPVIYRTLCCKSCMLS